jgi:cardiolipin synthase
LCSAPSRHRRIGAARTPPGWAPNRRDHRKILVVDGRVGFTGGINRDKVYENPSGDGIPADGKAQHAHWRDNAVRIERPAVAELQTLFFGTWKDQKGPPVWPAAYFPHLTPRGEQTGASSAVPPASGARCITCR